MEMWIREPMLGLEWREWRSTHVCPNCQTYTTPHYMRCDHMVITIEIQSLGNHWYEVAMYSGWEIVRFWNFRIERGEIWEIIHHIEPRGGLHQQHAAATAA